MLRRIPITTATTIVAGLVLRRIGLWSRGEPLRLTDRHGRPLAGSVSEKLYVDVNGVPQGMFVQSKSCAHPVLLYLHGGLPEYFLTERYPTGLENDFTVVWWEQRGAGLSYRPGMTPETVTLEQLIADTLTLTDYLRKRFGQQRIYLMAHSGGTFIGLHAVAQAPERYAAYIGVAQMVDALASEMLAYEYLLDRYRRAGDTRMVRRLEQAPVTKDGAPRAYLAVRDAAMHRLGVGTTRAMTSVFTGIFLPSWRSPQYTLSEKLRTWRGKLSCGVSVLWDQMVRTDLADELTQFRIPIYFLHGIHDYTCSYPLARGYFTRLTAPVKGFYSFAASAHSPIFEEPERVCRILREDVLGGANALADAQ